MAIFIVLGLILAFTIWAAWERNGENSSLEQQVPCVGVERDQWFAWFRARLRSFSMTEKWMVEGYHKYSRQNLPFIIPSFRKGKVLILPPAQLKAIYGKREDELHAHGPSAEALSFEYTIGDPAVYPSNYTVDVIRKWITKRFDELTPAITEELCLAVDEQFGLGDEWRDVELWPAVQRVFARGLNRVIVGFPLCRDATYLETVRRFAINMPFQGLFITVVPKILKPLLGPLISWQARRDTELGIKACMPLIKSRLSTYYENVGSRNKARNESQPVDILEWIIEASTATNDPNQLDPHRIGHRVMILNFNFVQGGSIPFSSVLSDICYGQHAPSTFARLREEAESVLGTASTTQPWDRKTISQLVLADSAIRESMRLSDFGLFALPRRVGSAHGITLDNGIQVPPGVHIEVPMHSIHMDESFHGRDAASFKPFRFADDASMRRSAVTLDESFLGFGYGRNACPGRFFGAHVMKVVLAYFIMNYDVEFGDELPPLSNLWEYRIPRESTCIRVKRRRSR